MSVTRLPDQPKVEPNANSIMSEIERTTAQTLTSGPNATHEQTLLNDSAVSGRPQPALSGTELATSTDDQATKHLHEQDARRQRRT